MTDENAWERHDDYPFEDWQHEVANGDTRLGYEDWVAHQREANDDQPPAGSEPGETQPSQIDQWLEAGRMADGQRMSDERLDEVFNLVKNPENWKNPIDATVPKNLATCDEIVTAVTWFAGGGCEVWEDPSEPGMWQVSAPGYYETIGS